MYIPADNVFKNFQMPQKGITQEKPKHEGLKKTAVLASAAGGLLMGLYLVGKQQRIDTFTKGGYKAIDHNFKAMTTLAGTSLLAGTTVGALLDKDNVKVKAREGLQQFVGNILFPIFAVTQGHKVFDKYKNNIKLPALKGNSGFTKGVNQVTKALPQVLVTAALLGAGLFVGNKVGNFLNNLLFEDKKTRKFKASDLSGHVDDLCVATTLVTKGTSIAEATANLIAPALIIPGYIAGTKTKADKH